MFCFPPRAVLSPRPCPPVFPLCRSQRALRAACPGRALGKSEPGRSPGGDTFFLFAFFFNAF